MGRAEHVADFHGQQERLGHHPPHQYTAFDFVVSLPKLTRSSVVRLSYLRRHSTIQKKGISMSRNSLVAQTQEQGSTTESRCALRDFIATKET